MSIITGTLILRHQLLVERIGMSFISSRSVALQAHVDDVRAVLDLPARDFAGLFPLLLGDHVLEQARADDVGSLADDQRPVAVFRFHQFDPGIIRPMRSRGKPRAACLPSAICAMA